MMRENFKAGLLENKRVPGVAHKLCWPELGWHPHTHREPSIVLML